MSSEVRKMNDYSEQESAGLKVTVGNDENLYSAGSDSM